MDLWWKRYTRWRARNFVGVNTGQGDGYLYRMEYHDGRYWRTMYPHTLRFVNREAAEAEIRHRGFGPEAYDESKKTVKWW